MTVASQDVEAYFGRPVSQDDILHEDEEIQSSVETESGDSVVDGVKRVDTSTFETLGVLIYKDERGVNVTEITIEDINNADVVALGIKKCMEYDYIGFSYDG